MKKPHDNKSQLSPEQREALENNPNVAIYDNALHAAYLQEKARKRKNAICDIIIIVGVLAIVCLVATGGLLA